MSVISQRIDLRHFSPGIYDQQQQNSCVANAVLQAIRLQSLQYRQDCGDLAREQIYYDARTADAKQQDSGASLIHLIQVAERSGVASQDVAPPYSGSSAPDSTMYRPPGDAVYADAATQKVFGHTSLSNFLRDDSGYLLNQVEVARNIRPHIETELMHGKVVLVSLDLPAWLYRQSGPLASQTDHADPALVGQHTLMIVGKDDQLHGGAYIVQNSWGAGWGDNGYGTIPYAYAGLGVTLTSVQVLNGFQGVDLTWTAARGKIAMLFSAVLDRAADHGGLVYWAATLEAGAAPGDIASAVLASGEGSARLGGLSNAAFVNDIYLNTMARVADPAANGYWSGLLDRGELSRAQFAYRLMDSVANSTGAQGMPTIAEHDFQANRSTVSANFALTYQIDGHLDLAHAALDQVSSDANSVQVALIGIQQALGWG